MFFQPKIHEKADEDNCPQSPDGLQASLPLQQLDHCNTNSTGVWMRERYCNVCVCVKHCSGCSWPLLIHCMWWAVVGLLYNCWLYVDHSQRTAALSLTVRCPQKQITLPPASEPTDSCVSRIWYVNSSTDTLSMANTHHFNKPFHSGSWSLTRSSVVWWVWAHAIFIYMPGEYHSTPVNLGLLIVETNIQHLISLVHKQKEIMYRQIIGTF